MSRHRANRRGQQKLHIPIEEDFLTIEEAPRVREEIRVEDEQLVEMLVESSRPSPTDHLDLLEFLDTLEVPQELAISECGGEVPDSPTREVEEEKCPTPPPEIQTVPSSTNSKQNQEAVDNRRRIFRQLGRNVPETPSQHPIQGYPFVMKLFLAAGSPAFPFLKWSESGLELEVDYVGLQEHLASGSSMFRSRSAVEFTAQLLDLGFERLWSRTSEDPQGGCIQLFFQHPKFAKGQLEELKALVEEIGQNQIEESLDMQRDRQRARPRVQDLKEDEDKEELQLPPLYQAPMAHMDRMSKRGDLCTSFHTFRAPLQIVRSRFQTLLAYQVDVQVLKDRKDSPATPQSTGKKSRNTSNNQPTEKTPAPKDSSSKFVKPQDSVITIGIGQAPDYAGFYGNVELGKVNEFFSEYLPRYGSKITGYKDIVMEATNKSNGFQQNLPIGLDYSDDDDDALPPISSCSMEVDVDVQPSTSAAARSKSSSRKPVDDMDLEQAMQELCDGPNANQPEKTSGSSSKAKPRGKPKSKKRLAKMLQSSSSENDDVKEFSPEPVKEAHEVVPSRTIKKEKIELVDEEDPENSFIVEIEVQDDAQMTLESEETPEQQMKELHGVGADNESEVEEAEEEGEDEEEAEAEAEDDEEEEVEEEEEEEEEVEEDDDDDYNDKNVQYRTDPQPAKRRRYDLRNSKRSSL